MKKLFILFAAAALIFAASCGGDSTESELAPTPSVPELDDKIVVADNTDLSPVFSQDGDSKTIRFTTNKPWQAYVDDTRAAADWLHVSPEWGEAGEAELTIIAERNENPDDRTGYVKIVSGNSSVTISVTQKQRDALTVSPSQKSIDAPETEFEIEVRANIQFEVEVKADWIEQISTRAMTTTVLKFKAKRNIGEERTGTIVIRSGDKSETIAITQEKGDFIVDTGQFNIDAAAQSVSANVRANIDFEVKSEAEWIHYNPTRAMTSYTLSFDIDENTTGKERTGKVTISSGGKSETITIIQSDVVFEMEFDKTEVSREGGTITATVKSNMEYAIVLPNEVDWLTCADTRAITTKTHNFKIEANPNLETRSAIIKFVYQSEKGEATKQVTVTQKASDIGVDCALYELDVIGGQVNVNVQGNTASASDIKYNITQGAEWIHGTETRAVTAQFTFNIDKNTTGEPREGEIEFTLPDKAGTKVRIVQSTVDNTEIVHFADELFKEYMVAVFDKNKDGEISRYEASLIKSISCSSKYIQSLEGIEYCTALKTLACSGNQLTALDVSNNTTLTYLDCGWNLLTALDVNGCSALTTLDCNGNQLTALDASGCSALTTLDCVGNKLTALNVSGCSALEYLACSSNPLTALDVSGCSALRNLSCSNQLTSLDVSKNTRLETLSCDSNQLTSLDVSKNTRLEALACSSNPLTALNVSGCSALTVLSCNSNQLTVLDVSGCSALAILHCYSNPLTALNVSGCSALREFYCYSNQLTALDVSGCSALTELRCYSNKLTALDVSSNTRLVKLDCYSNQLTALNVSTRLTSLYCHSNQLTSLDVSSNIALEVLSCGGNQLTTLDVSKTNLGNSNKHYSLDCSDMPTLQTLYLKTGWRINGVNVNRSTSYIPEQTEILYKD